MAYEKIQLNSNLNLNTIDFFTFINKQNVNELVKELLSSNYKNSMTILNNTVLTVDGVEKIILTKEFTLETQSNIAINMQYPSLNQVINFKILLDDEIISVFNNSINTIDSIKYLIKNVSDGIHTLSIKASSTSIINISKTLLVLEIFGKGLKISNEGGMSIEDVITIINNGSNSDINNAVEDKAIDLINNQTSTEINTIIQAKIQTIIKDNYINLNVLDIVNTDTDLIEINIEDFIDFAEIETENLIIS